MEKPVNLAEHTDSWGHLNQAQHEQSIFIARLEAMGVIPALATARQDFLAALQLQAGQSVLEVGCGPGTALADLAHRVSPTGQIFGIDPTAFFIDYARQKAQKLGLTNATYQQGDARSLEWPSETFDASFCDKVLLHAGPAQLILAELKRVVRPGGWIGALEYDCDSWAVYAPDLSLARQIVEANRDEQYDGFMGRQLPALLSEAGLSDLKVGHFAAFSTSLTSSPYWLACLEIMSERAVKRGVFSEAARQHWLAEQRELDQTGRFLICIGGFWATGRKAD